jgi:hypothetical protein
MGDHIMHTFDRDSGRPESITTSSYEDSSSEDRDSALEPYMATSPKASSSESEDGSSFETISLFSHNSQNQYVEFNLMERYSKYVKHPTAPDKIHEASIDTAINLLKNYASKDLYRTFRHPDRHYQSEVKQVLRNIKHHKDDCRTVADIIRAVREACKGNKAPLRLDNKQSSLGRRLTFLKQYYSIPKHAISPAVELEPRRVTIK